MFNFAESVEETYRWRKKSVAFFRGWTEIAKKKKNRNEEGFTLFCRSIALSNETLPHCMHTDLQRGHLFFVFRFGLRRLAMPGPTSETQEVLSFLILCIIDRKL